MNVSKANKRSTVNWWKTEKKKKRKRIKTLNQVTFDSRKGVFFRISGQYTRTITTEERFDFAWSSTFGTDSRFIYLFFSLRTRVGFVMLSLSFCLPRSSQITFFFRLLLLLFSVTVGSSVDWCSEKSVEPWSVKKVHKRARARAYNCAGESSRHDDVVAFLTSMMMVFFRPVRFACSPTLLSGEQHLAFILFVDKS